MTIFSKLIRVLWDATKELKLQSLTESDLLIYMLFVESAIDGQVTMTFARFMDLCQVEGIKISKAQYYKSIRTLESAKLLQRISSERSHRYAILSTS